MSVIKELERIRPEWRPNRPPGQFYLGLRTVRPERVHDRCILRSDHGREGAARAARPRRGAPAAAVGRAAAVRRAGRRVMQGVARG